MKCNCGENAFYIKKTYSENKWVITSEVYKCGRNIDNTKKTKCDFIFEKELSRELSLANQIKEKQNSILLGKKNPYFIDYKVLIYRHLTYYDSRLTNYFGTLNYYLAKYKIPVHIPKIENYEELKYRIDCFFNEGKIIKLKEKRIAKIDSNLDNYTCNEYLSKTDIYEYDKANIDYFNDFRKLFKEDTFLLNLNVLSLKDEKKKKSKNTVSKRKMRNLNIKDDEYDDCVDEEVIIKSIISNDSKETKFGLESESESESESETELDKDNQFDVEVVFSEDEIDVDDYGEFSD